MPDITMNTIDGGSVTVESASITELEKNLTGGVLTADSPAYDETRAIWNGMIDRCPGLIARCANADDVTRAVAFASDNGLVVSVRGVGHNIAGNAVCDGGLMIDLLPMKSVEVDASARTARVGPGVTLGELDAATQAHGLATPVGINSTTGIAGLTLGGGFGWLSRKYGLTIDNLLSADVVTAAGETLHASEDENPDLFWGIRGGGGNFGIVTSFEFQLHPVGPEVFAGLIVHPFEDARNVLDFYRDFTAQAPDELAVWVVLRKAPPLPFLPEDVHGKEVLVLAGMYAGNMEDGEKAFAPLREFGTPIADVMGPHPYVGFQAAFDPLLVEGMRNYWKSHDFRELSDELLDTLVGAAAELPDPQCEIFMGRLGGAVNRVSADATAYARRDVELFMNLHGRWEHASDDERVMSWCRDLFDRVSPYATGAAYVNFMTDEGTDRIRQAYGDSYDRLAKLKHKYDPRNMFRLNQNIQPAG